MFTKSAQSIRLKRIVLRAQDYDFNLIYEPGTGNNADGLSRLPVTSAGTEVKFVEEHVNFVKKDSTLLSIEEIQEAGKKDTELQKVVICRNCETCVRLQPLHRDTPCKPTPLHEHCWDKCKIDLVGSFPGQICILTLVACRSKWPEATRLRSTTSQKIISVLTEVFARFGNPKVLTMDPSSCRRSLEAFSS